MRAVWLLFACGCNSIFGLKETTPLYFDGSVDAAPRCPSGEAPTFRPAYVQVPVSQCFGYVPSASGWALARCLNTLWQGGADGALTEASFPDPANLSDPRLAPEGTLAILKSYPGGHFDLYRRNADDSWSLDHRIFPGLDTRQISTPTRGPDRRAIVTEFDTDHYQISELTDPGMGLWSVVDSYSVDTIGVASISDLGLTADGLHLVFRGALASGESGVLYAERSSVTSRFGTAKYIASVSTGAETPFMTEDCGRIYFSGLDTVFYLGQ